MKKFLRSKCFACHEPEIFPYLYFSNAGTSPKLEKSCEGQPFHNITNKYTHEHMITSIKKQAIFLKYAHEHMQYKNDRKQAIFLFLLYKEERKAVIW